VVEIRPAVAANVAAIVRLLEDVDHFYGDEPSGPIEARAGQVEGALFGDRPSAFALLAWHGDALVGLATYSYLWPAAGVTHSLYLKELYVAESHRRSGIGRLLMDQLFDIAKAHGCSRVEWTTEQSNVDARRFYESLGSRLQEAKLLFRVDL
jgi:GNAT superfamily N-acetyltransferase